MICHSFQGTCYEGDGLCSTAAPSGWLWPSSWANWRLSPLKCASRTYLSGTVCPWTIGSVPVTMPAWFCSCPLCVRSSVLWFLESLIHTSLPEESVSLLGCHGLFEGSCCGSRAKRFSQHTVTLSRWEVACDLQCLFPRRNNTSPPSLGTGH